MPRLVLKRESAQVSISCAECVLDCKIAELIGITGFRFVEL